MLVHKPLLVAIDFNSVFFHTIEVNGYQQLFGYSHYSKIFFYIQQKKETHKGLDQLEAE